MEGIDLKYVWEGEWNQRCLCVWVLERVESWEWNGECETRPVYIYRLRGGIWPKKQKTNGKGRRGWCERGTKHPFTPSNMALSISSFYVKQMRGDWCFLKSWPSIKVGNLRVGLLPSWTLLIKCSFCFWFTYYLGFIMGPVTKLMDGGGHH